jgi:hypothetical protein
MSKPKMPLASICFIALFAVGGCLLFVGLLVEPYMPHFLLDHVLSPAELADSDKRDAMLALLERAQGNRWLLYSLAGISVMALSGVGLWAMPRRESPNDPSASN